VSDVGALLARVGGGIFQNAWVVPDLAAAQAAFTTAFGCDDWVQFEMDPVWHIDGEAVSSPISCSFARAGNQQIELMQPLGQEGIVATHLARFGPGPHHLGTRVDDLDAAVAAATADGFPVAMRADIGPLRLAFLDTVDALGVHLELLEDPDGMLWATKPWRDDP
jgi:catechol 2,3-dioxygenase-like lactoylglutathione lyase family enzyme